jgi:nicotinate phosphoribosyltransferase
MTHTTPHALLTDLYQLTMNAAYLDNQKDDTATFELFIRKLPDKWNYFIANGIEEAIDYATHVRFTEDDIAYLRSKKLFSDTYLKTLEEFRFSGDIYAVKEGTPVFPNEPLLRITGKRTEVQFLETALLTIINYQTMQASKASRVVQAAGPAKVVDFGLRRAQGQDAGIKGARAAYIAGATGTSDVQAGLEYKIPIVGTHAHSFVMSFPTELDAFRAYAKTFPENATLLIDTYDTLQGARNAATVAKELRRHGHALGAVRLDSGDLATLAKDVRNILNDEGLHEVRIIASNDLNEEKITALRKADAPIDAYGVGTEMITAKPVAAISGVYKLVEDGQGGKMKLSADKISFPGKHQVHRVASQDGTYSYDVVALEGERVMDGTPLLELAASGGKRVRPEPALDAIRAYSLKEVERLRSTLKGTESHQHYFVSPSNGLVKLMDEITAQHKRENDARRKGTVATAAAMPIQPIMEANL